MSAIPLQHLPASISLEAASRIIDAALAAAREMKLAPMAFAVLDAGGHLVAFKREDGLAFLRCEIAQGKAWTSLALGLPSRGTRDRLKERPAFLNALAATSGGRLIPVPGGILVKDGAGRIVGAVGGSGDASDKDEACAIMGVKAAGLVPVPAEPIEGYESAGH